VTPARREFTRALEHVYVCDSDLEDELIRAVGAERLQQIIEEQAELHSFRTLQKQPAQRARTIEQQLRVFLGNRKIRYAELLVGELDLANVPRPLDALLAAVGAPPASPPREPARY
jgi:hypothetical protein